MCDFQDRSSISEIFVDSIPVASIESAVLPIRPVGVFRFGTNHSGEFKSADASSDNKPCYFPLSARVHPMNHTILGMLIPILLAGAPLPESYLFPPSYALREDPRGPVEFYVPRPGDLFLGTDESFFIRFGHTIVGGAGVHHSGIIFARPDGSMALIEAGPFNEMVVRVLDPYQHMSNHVARGTKVWVR